MLIIVWYRSNVLTNGRFIYHSKAVVARRTEYTNILPLSQDVISAYDKNMPMPIAVFIVINPLWIDQIVQRKEQLKQWSS